ncbi:MAG: hypothetical protein FJX57_00725 [Alphaproteobacteria bacterium]|nr:hypothetical protein [Alphaproteobacteria bacterium]
MPRKQTSQLINDLSAIPGIVAGLGLGIAEAQKAMNLAYLEAVERLIALTGSLLGSAPAGTTLDAKSAEVLTSLLRDLAPSRYQFSETTMSVKLDLSQEIRGSASVGGGAALGAVVVNAGLTVGFAYDYRAAAELRTVIHAAPAGRDVFDSLKDRAAEIGKDGLTLPAGSVVDAELLTSSERVYQKLVGAAPAKKIEIEKP